MVVYLDFREFYYKSNTTYNPFVALLLGGLVEKMSYSTQTANHRMKQLFKYLEALNQHRNPAIMNVEDYSWKLWIQSLPKHSNLKLLGKNTNQLDMFNLYEDGDDIDLENIIVIRRPKLKDCPPPQNLKSWLHEGWENPFKETQIIESRPKEKNEFPFMSGDSTEKNNTELEYFNDNESRVIDYLSWLETRKVWAEEEKESRKAMKIYEDFYDLYRLFKREPDRFEIVLGDGVITWSTEEGRLYHPLLLQQVLLQFDPEKVEFTILPSDRPSEFYSQIFHSNADVDASSIADAIKSVNQERFHPLGGTGVEIFLKSFISSVVSNGEFIEDSESLQFKDHPQIVRKPVLFLRNKDLGFASCIEKILENIERGKEPSNFFKNIVGIDQDDCANHYDETFSRKTIKPNEILLGKESNEEQIKIAESLEVHDSVLVQGPPGTGKSHTIANLIGHLLAQGERVLVTSKTSKPLRVLKRHMAKEIRSLAVSVLQDDLEAKKDLESSVNEIVKNLTSKDPQILIQQEKRLIENRDKVLSELNQFKAQLIEALRSEYTEIAIDGQTLRPSEAGKRIAQGLDIHSWLPDPDAPEKTLPITQEEFDFIFEFNDKMSKEEEALLMDPLPELSELPTSEELFKMKEDYESSRQFIQDPFDALWDSKRCISSKDIKSVWNFAQLCLKALVFEDNWQKEVLYDGYLGGNRFQPWEDLLEKIEDISQSLNEFKPQRVRLKPEIDYPKLGLSKEEVIKELKEIVNYLSDNNELSSFKLFLKPKWKKITEASEVSLGKPQNRDHYIALLTKVKYERQKELLINSLVELCPTLACIREETPDEDLVHNLSFQVKPMVSRYLYWYSSEISPLIVSLGNLGFKWEKFHDPVQGSESREAAIENLKESLEKLCYQTLPIRIKKLDNIEISQKLEEIITYLENLESENNHSFICDMKSYFKYFDIQAYEESTVLLQKLYQMKPLYQKKQNIIEKLTGYSKEWANLVKKRVGIWSKSQSPGDLPEAWEWKRLQLEVKRINQASIEDLQDKIVYRQDVLKNLTNKLISVKAWKNQIKRTTQRERSALVAYTQIIKKLGKTGKVKNAAALLRDAREAMNQCISAVPVWIMPLIKVAESFEPASTSFDVVIIDEASQCDVMAFIAIYLGKKLVIVGDDQQVSPLAIGQKLDIVRKLMDQYLLDIPVKSLYDGTASIYDIAKRNSGKVIGLREHFRSVPEIIQFSNRLSYNGNILPLRESSSTDLKPPVIPFRVNNGYCDDDKVNSVEAKQIASIMAACTKLPKYEGKTMGVISLYGDSQTLEIEKYLKEYISEDVYEKHEILCGSPYHFQGDERDVIFLSLVYSSLEDPPHKMLGGGQQNMYKKRFNVAASRARDQMWVVYSLDPYRDLKPGDLRRQLIEYSLDPTAWEITFEDLEKQTESPFEREVLQDLVFSGYDVMPQWKVGAYRIDMVVQGNGKKVAIECDGERFHTPETLHEDLARQSILERLGWTFIRIRGSAFYSDKAKTMEKVKDKLGSLGVERTMSSQNSNFNKEPLAYNYEVSEIVRLASMIQNEEKDISIPNNLSKPSVAFQKEESFIIGVNQGESADFVDTTGIESEGIMLDKQKIKDDDPSSYPEHQGKNQSNEKEVVASKKCYSIDSKNDAATKTLDGMDQIPSASQEVLGKDFQGNQELFEDIFEYKSSDSLEKNPDNSLQVSEEEPKINNKISHCCPR
jgi:very-short-patch-repair endonuclease